MLVFIGFVSGPCCHWFSLGLHLGLIDLMISKVTIFPYANINIKIVNLPMKSPKKMDRAALEKVARLFSAFSDATRLAILMELKEGPHTVGELVDRVGVSQGNVSKQLQLLYDHGILERSKNGNQVIYSIKDDFIFPLCRQVCEKLNRDAQASVDLLYHI
jgi:DNA-binding transcriptional ArsR family regulator